MLRNVTSLSFSYRKFKHYDSKASYEALLDIGQKHHLILDVGCGDGKKTIIHKDFSEVLVGIDRDTSHFKEVKMRDILAVNGDATKLPFKNGSYDAILSFHVIEHIEKDLTFINEIYRVLKVSSCAILITPNRIRLNSIIYRTLARPEKKYPMNPEHVFEYTKKDLETLLKQSNFEHYEIRPIGLVRLPNFEISTIPRFLSRYSDQLMVILKKPPIVMKIK